MRVTAEILRSRGACEDQVLLFERLSLHNRGVIDLEGKFLEEWCVACATCFDWYWAALHLLPAPASRRWLEVQRQAGDVFLRSTYNSRSDEHFRRYKTTIARAFARYAEGYADPTVLKVARGAHDATRRRRLITELV